MNSSQIETASDDALISRSNAILRGAIPTFEDEAEAISNELALRAEEDADSFDFEDDGDDLCFDEDDTFWI